MKKFDLVYLIAGVGSRYNGFYRKSWELVDNKPLFTYALVAFFSHPSLNKAIIVTHPLDLEKVKAYLAENHYPLDKIVFTTGGKTRAKSVRNGLNFVKAPCFVIHDGVRPFVTSEDIDALLKALDEADGVTFYHPVADTVKAVEGKIVTLNRNALKAVTTPQGFNLNTLNLIQNPKIADENILDEIMLIENELKVSFLEETHPHTKLTNPSDLELIKNILEKNKTTAISQANSIGISFDFHPFEKNRPLVLSGITIPFDKGLAGHSDADVVYHVVAESIMGALKLGDLGTLFPDNDPAFKNMTSSYFIKEVMKHVKNQKAKILHIDVTIFLEQPKLYPYKYQMAKNIAGLLSISENNVSVKATTMEKRGLVGKGEGVAAEAVCLVKRNLDN